MCAATVLKQFLLMFNIVRHPIILLNKPAPKLLRDYNGMMMMHHLSQTCPVFADITYMSKQQLHYCVQCCRLSSVQCFIIIDLLYSSSTRCYFNSPLPSSHVTLPENTVLTASNTITQSHLPPIWSAPSSQGLKSTAIPSHTCQRLSDW